jgi:ankyrin repeat protein
MGVKPGDTDPARRLQPAPGPDHDRDADGRTRLMRAVLRGDAAIATLLLQQGADPLATDHLGQSARGYAAASGNPELLKVFDLAP